MLKKMVKYLYSTTFHEHIYFMPPHLQNHRGFWISGIKENTLESLKKSYELGYKMCEFDVRITKDQQVILFHDDYISNLKISELTLSEINERVSVQTLEDVFDWYKKVRSQNMMNSQSDESNKNKLPQLKYQFYLNIEIKSKSVFDRNLEKIILNLILKNNLKDSILISSFNPMSLTYFKKNCPKLPRALLLTYNNDHGNNFVIKSQILNFFAKPHFLHLDERYWLKKKYSNLLELKVPIVLWTCNDVEKVKNYFEQGIYGVISDSVQPKDIESILAS